MIGAGMGRIGSGVCVCVWTRFCPVLSPPVPADSVSVSFDEFYALSRCIGSGDAMEGGRRWTCDIGVWHGGGAMFREKEWEFIDLHEESGISSIHDVVIIICCMNPLSSFPLLYQ